MAETEHEVEAYVSHIAFPVSKEELINGLLVRNAPGRMVALVERLPQASYDSRAQMRQHLDEVSEVHAREVATARTYEDFLEMVVRHVGDVRHTSKEEYNRVVEHVVHLARQQGTLDGAESRTMQQRLEAAFADLHGSMSEVYDYSAPIDPHLDVPRPRDQS